MTTENQTRPTVTVVDFHSKLPLLIKDNKRLEVILYHERVTPNCPTPWGTSRRAFTGRTYCVIWDGRWRHVGISQMSKQEQKPFDRKHGFRIAVERAMFQYHNFIFINTKLNNTKDQERASSHLGDGVYGPPTAEKLNLRTIGGFPNRKWPLHYTMDFALNPRDDIPMWMWRREEGDSVPVDGAL